MPDQKNDITPDPTAQQANVPKHAAVHNDMSRQTMPIWDNTWPWRFDLPKVVWGE